MSTALTINGKELYPIKEIAEKVPYSRDYITRLAREGKIVASTVGRQWFVDLESLRNYVEASAMEQELRKKQLSEERKRERQTREAAERLATIQVKRTRTLPVRSVVATALVLGLGLLSGWAGHFLVSNSPQSQLQLASTGESTSPRAANTESSPIGSSVPSPAATPIEPAKRVAALGAAEEGILLLPQATTTQPIELFSDRVEVRLLLDGTQVMVRVDEHGNPVGNPVPFVTVPVKQQNI